MKKLILVSLVVFFAGFDAMAQSQEYLSINIDYKEKLGRINQKVFDALIAEKVKAFDKDLETAYNKDEVIEHGRREKVVQIYPDPNDPYYYIDSIVAVPFRDQVTGYSVNYNDNGQITAIVFIRMEGDQPEGTENPLLENIFWLKWKDLRAALKEDEMGFLERFIKKYSGR